MLIQLYAANISPKKGFKRKPGGFITDLGSRYTEFINYFKLNIDCFGNYVNVPNKDSNPPSCHTPATKCSFPSYGAETQCSLWIYSFLPNMSKE